MKNRGAAWAAIALAVALLGLVEAKRSASNLVNLPSVAVFRSEASTRDCIKTPGEYVQAFKDREERCVSKDLIGRISQGFNPATGRGFPLDVSQRAAYFFAGSDALAKFLVIGFPETVGDFVENLSKGSFAGLQEISNGQAFLEGVGFSAADIDISQLFTLNIFSRKAIRAVVLSPLTNNFTAFEADIPAVRPTWLTVRNFMEDTFRKQGVEVSDEAVEVLNTKSFAELTGCPAECSYSPVNFPSPASTNAVVRGTRTGRNSCDPPAGPPGTFIQVEPTSLDPTSAFCSATWLRFYTKYVDLFTRFSCSNPRDAPASVLNANLARVARSLAEDLASASTPEEEAIVFRAYLAQNCGGAFNSLFSGDSFTATGFGGLVSPTSSEWIVSPFYQEEVSEENKAAIPFCINGQNGGRPNPDGSCALIA